MKRLSYVRTGTLDIHRYLYIYINILPGMDFRGDQKVNGKVFLCDEASGIVALSLPYHPVFLYCGRCSGHEPAPGGVESWDEEVQTSHKACRLRSRLLNTVDAEGALRNHKSMQILTYIQYLTADCKGMLIQNAWSAQCVTQRASHIHSAVDNRQ